MNDKIDNVNESSEVIELGVASVDTHGINLGRETTGGELMSGISED